MTIPTFRDIPGKAVLQKVDWADKGKAAAAITSLDGDLKYNTKARGDFLSIRKKIAEQIVEELESTIPELNSMAKRKAVKMPDLGKLKERRTAVKTMMGEAKDCEVAFFASMSNWRGGTTFDLPPKVEAVVSKLRGTTQTNDKQYADIPNALVALEARASAAFKTVNALLGAYEDDAKTIAKMQAAADKLGEMEKKALTAAERIESSCGFVAKNMANKDKKIAGLCAVKASEIAKEASSVVQFQVAVKAGVNSIKAMLDSLVDPNMKTVQGQPIYDDSKQKLVNVLSRMNGADKVLSDLLKEKALPKDLKSALPSGVK